MDRAVPRRGAARRFPEPLPFPDQVMPELHGRQLSWTHAPVPLESLPEFRDGSIIRGPPTEIVRNGSQMSAAQDSPKGSGGTGNTGGGGGKLYAAREKIHPRKVQGFWRRVKTWTLLVLLAIYFIGPWIPWERAGDTADQAILLDMAGRRGYFLWIEIWPQEVYYLTGLLVLGAIVLFFATSLFGRVWCGFTCPQTVWTDLYFFIERWIEGDRTRRMRLDRKPFTDFEKIWRKSVKHLIWLAIAVYTALNFLMYFDYAPAVLPRMLDLEYGAGTYSMLALLTFTTYVLGGWAKEQVCIYMCPWPRFQGAMLDEHSRIVTYEEWRGEPRGHAKPGQSFDGRGHCVDCKLCVQVCPTGTDIREGTQLSCIGCALCIDACNGVMDKFGLPRGLITYDSTYNQVERAKGGEEEVFPIFHARNIAYVVLIGLTIGIMAYGLTTRSRMEVNILHDRSPLFVPLSDGTIRNGYTYKILNMAGEGHTYELSLGNLESARMKIIGHHEEPVRSAELPVARDKVGSFRIFVTAPRKALDGDATDLEFVLTNLDTGETTNQETVFSGPRR